MHTHTYIYVCIWNVLNEQNRPMTYVATVLRKTFSFWNISVLCWQSKEKCKVPGYAAFTYCRLWLCSTLVHFVRKCFWMSCITYGWMADRMPEWILVLYLCMYVLSQLVVFDFHLRFDFFIFFICYAQVKICNKVKHFVKVFIYCKW